MMEKNFEEYMIDWWREFVEDHKSESKRLMETFIGEEETVDDYLDDNETPYDWLMTKDNADEIYSNFFGYDARQLYFDDLPDTQTFLLDMYKQAYSEEYSFVNDLVYDMAYHSEGYGSPDLFFDDLSKGGCASGMIGMFISNYDCKLFYIEHIDDMEEFVSEMEEELGEPIRNRQSLPHYTFVCWLCYEELAYSIARTLFPDKF